RYCVQEHDGVALEDTWVLRLDKETGEFDPWRREGKAAFEQDLRGFRSALATTRAIREAEGWVKEMMSVRRTLAAEEAAAEKLVRDSIACPKSTEYKGVRLSKCLPSGEQCQKCKSIYEEKHK